MSDVNPDFLAAFDNAKAAPTVAETMAKIRELVAAHEFDNDDNKLELSVELSDLAEDIDPDNELGLDDGDDLFDDDDAI